MTRLGTFVEMRNGQVPTLAQERGFRRSRSVFKGWGNAPVELSIRWVVEGTAKSCQVLEVRFG
jgi:hypothetical protein